jgi:release factor glutamine methyltransferase
VVTVLELIQRSTVYLTRKGVDAARLQSELLLAHVLKVPRLNLYLNFDRLLTPVELEAMRGVVKRRGQREPLQHVVGTTSFCGLELSVGPAVLVPRPETEVLAEQAWRFLNSLPSPFPAAPRVLDFGTGSGCLAITIAVQCPTVRVVAVDISPAAVSVARANAIRHRVADRIDFIVGDGLAALAPAATFDLLVSNPPYIPETQIGSLMPEVRDFDPHIALDGGPDGLEFYRHLAAHAGGFLRPNGRIMLEFGDDQAAALARIYAAPAWSILTIVPDFSNRPRILTAGRDSELS